MLELWAALRRLAVADARDAPGKILFEKCNYFRNAIGTSPT
jgi:hypothetical protein